MTPKELFDELSGLISAAQPNDFRPGSVQRRQIRKIGTLRNERETGGFGKVPNLTVTAAPQTRAANLS